MFNLWSGDYFLKRKKKKKTKGLFQYYFSGENLWEDTGYPGVSVMESLPDLLALKYLHFVI